MSRLFFLHRLGFFVCSASFFSSNLGEFLYGNSIELHVVKCRVTCLFCCWFFFWTSFAPIFVGLAQKWAQILKLIESEINQVFKSLETNTKYVSYTQMYPKYMLCTQMNPILTAFAENIVWIHFHHNKSI